MFLTKSKWIPIEEAIVGKEYCAYQTASGLSCYAPYIYLGNNRIQSIWSKRIEENKNIIKLEVKLSDNEYQDFLKETTDFTNSKTQLNLYGIFTDLYDVGDASHEMWNGWIETNWYELNTRISDEDFTIAGIAPAPWAPDYFYEPVAIVAEEEDGCRFWCHIEKQFIEKMRNDMREIYEDIIK